MKKGIWLSLFALVVVGAVGYVLWTINRRGELQGNSKGAFIPANSALVLHLNPGTELPEGLRSAFAPDKAAWETGLLHRAVTALCGSDLIAPTSTVMALRAEGKKRQVSLYVMDNKNVLAGGDVVEFLQTKFGKDAGSLRRYDRYKIYALHGDAKESLFYAVEEGMVLLSDSELYVEDALKRFEQMSDEETANQSAHGLQIEKYFSPSAGLNLYLNANYFTDVLPSYLNTKRIFPHLDLTACFKWGALDGEVMPGGVGLNGFMAYNGMEASYMRTLEGQKAMDSEMESVVPADASSFTLLTLSDFKAYLTALENYRYNAALIEGVRRRRQALASLLGKDSETELRELLQGKFALVTTSYNARDERNEGLVIAEAKAGGLCKTWIEKAIGKCARARNQHPDSYVHRYAVDGGQTCTYYRCPEDDLPSLYWGYLFEGIPARVVMVQDNYMVFASSEKVMASFIRSHVHRRVIRDVEWYGKLKEKLSVRSNLAYFAQVESLMPYYCAVAGKEWMPRLSADGGSPLVSALAMQWSNEDGILYHSSFFSTEKGEDRSQPHLLWQTKLGAKVSRKPVAVVNHNTKEREFFVQDDANEVLLLNDGGRVLWHLSLNEPINSEVVQVDALRNGKLQYLFSTSTRLHLVDRNGHYVSGYPVTLKSPTAVGMSLCDYDHNRNYRIFVPGTDQRVVLYDIRGQIVKDWNAARTDKEVVTRVSHYRVGDKDYIVYADRYRLYIRDRRGNERTRVSAAFDLPDNATLYRTQRAGKSVLAFANRDGSVNIVDFAGNVEKVKGIDATGAFCFNVADMNRGADVFLFTAGNRLTITDMHGKRLVEKELDAKSLEFPYVYRFSASDVRVGLLDREGNQMLLLSTDKGVSAGFPITGESPFTIVFGDSGNFYLYAGADGGNLIKYKVQR